MPRGMYERRSQTSQEVDRVEPQTAEQAVSPRAAEMRRERRRRQDGDLDRMGHMKLAVPRELQDQLRSEGKVYRWILDTGFAAAHADDWDKVDGIEPVQANPREGTDEKLVLCAKYRDWVEEDAKADMRELDARDKAMAEGRVSDGGRTSEGLYVPSGQQNRISQQ